MNFEDQKLFINEMSVLAYYLYINVIFPTKAETTWFIYSRN